MELALTCVAWLAMLSRAAGENNLTALFHEALSNDGSLQSSVGVSGAMSDLELVYLHRHPTPAPPTIVLSARDKRSGSAGRMSYFFSAFGRNYNLKLEKTSHLVSPGAKVTVVGPRGGVSVAAISPASCHYIHVDDDITAALNACKPGTIAGYIVSRDVTLEVRPLGKRAAGELHHAFRKRGAWPSSVHRGIPHVVKRMTKDSQAKDSQTKDSQAKDSQKRPNPTHMELEIPPPACSESISNATPDDLEFGQGELFTIPPAETSPVTPALALPGSTPIPGPSDPPPTAAPGRPIEEDPEGVFIPPLPFKRSLGQAGDSLSDREPKPMGGFHREPKPVNFDSTPSPPGDREPKPMQGFDREPRPMNRVLRGPPGMDREPKPMQGMDREPKPMREPGQGPVLPDAELNREPKPMQGFDREPRPMNRGMNRDLRGPSGMDREPKPVQGFDREPKPMREPGQGPELPETELNREPKPMQGMDREPRVTPTKRNGEKTVELGVFVDQAAHDLFLPYLGSQAALTDVVLGYVNGIQALFHHPSLGQKIHLAINHIEIMAAQPSALPHYGGHREQLYDAFRLYNEERKEQAANLVDGRPWDMGILISGLNFYSVHKKDGRTSYSTMGLAAVWGVCHPGYSAVIVELGATDTWGKPYPSAGFASVYVMAHEMGHNLGMLHDGYGNACPKNGFVMSASRSTSGETNWSSCSREVVETLSAPCLNDNPPEIPKHDHSVYDQLPGQTWDAYDQCRVFLRDDDATLYNESLAELHSVCNTVMCRSPHRIGYFKAGPALDGTYCGAESWCVAGSCTPWPPSKAPDVVLGGWSPWQHTGCESGCIHNSTGVQMSKRACSNPKPRNTEKRCSGVDATVNLCDDSKVCQGARVSITEYADRKCDEFSNVVPDLKPIGAMAPHNPERKWQACAVFCQRSSGTWYSPRTDLSHLPHFDTYFPDGTLCHVDAEHKYYCQRHQCLPKGARQAKELHEPDPEWDVHVYQNAPPRPSNNTVPEEVAKIFELTQNMDPLMSEPLDLYHVDDEELWIDDDYLHV